MSEERNGPEGEAEDAFDKAKEAAEDAAEQAKEAAGDFASEAKKTAEEFNEGLKEVMGENKKLVAGIFAIFLGGIGVHKFILGYTKEGIILAVLGLGGIWLCGGPTAIASAIGLIEGIIYLTKTDEEFYNTYQVGRKPWF